MALSMELDQERERFYSRLATIPGIQPMPSIRNWILLQVKNPQDLSRKVNRRLSPGTMSVPRHVGGAVRISVADPKTNESLYRTVREIMLKRLGPNAFSEEPEGDEVPTADAI